MKLTNNTIVYELISQDLVTTQVKQLPKMAAAQLVEKVSKMLTFLS